MSYGALFAVASVKSDHSLTFLSDEEGEADLGGPGFCRALWAAVLFVVVTLWSLGIAFCNLRTLSKKMVILE
jgi:hypothetical protein